MTQTEQLVPKNERKGPKCQYLMDDGRRCRNAAGQGTSHPGYGICAKHGGEGPTLLKAGLKLMAADAVATYGLPRKVDPHTALLEEVHRTAGHVEYLSSKIRSMEADQLAWGMVSEELLRERVAQQSAGENGGLEIIPGNNEALEKIVKRRVSMAAGASVWLVQYEKERKHLVDVCATAIKCGIAERQVKLSEEYARMISAVFVASLKDLGIDPYTEQSRAILRKNLLLVAANPNVE